MAAPRKPAGPAPRARARADEPRVLRLYRRLTQRCRTPNQVAKVHIALENRLGPLEVQVLHTVLMSQRSWRSDWRFFATRTLAQVSQRVPLLFGALGRGAQRSHQRRRWIKRLQAMLARSGKLERAEPFARQRLGPGIARYSADPGGARRAEKTLLIGFTGSSARLMLPLPTFLQHLDADRHDLVLVQYPPGRGFFAGMPGVAADIAGCIDRIGALARPGEYRRAATLGTSGGALPALFCAARLGLDIAIGVGSKGPDDPRWQTVLGSSAGERLAADLARHGSATHVFLVVGADHPKDQAAAHALAAATGARVLSVSDSRELVGHNPFVPLLRRGELSALLATTVDAPLPGLPPPQPLSPSLSTPAPAGAARSSRPPPGSDGTDAMRRRIAGLVALVAAAAVDDRVLLAMAAPPPGEPRAPGAAAPSPAWQATFSALCDTLVPADALTPAASALGVDRVLGADILDDADATRLVAAGCAWLDAGAGRAGFAGVDAAARTALVTRMAAEPYDSPQGRCYVALRNSVFEAYYAHPASWRGLAIDRPPQPVGFFEAVR